MKMKPFDIAALGEALIDFTPAGTTPDGKNLFEQNPGGAPLNVLAMAAKLGMRTAMISKVGNDGFGRFLRGTAENAGIDVTYVLTDPQIPTTAAFVQLQENGERSFSFYRKPGADVLLREEEVPEEVLSSCRIFHFGGVSLTDEPCRTATLAAAGKAKDRGAFVSYDPNYRPLLWNGERRAARELKSALRLADLVKVSEEEMTLLTGTEDIETGSELLLREGPSAVLVTCGENGSYVRTGELFLREASFPVDAVDTTGAGDAFTGTLLSCLAEESDIQSCASFSERRWREILRKANAAGALTATKKGAIPALPSEEQIGALAGGSR